MNAAAAIAVRDLVKRYPKRDANAVDGVSFTVSRGEIFGLLGPNGAGKSTMIGVLTTRVRATSGTVNLAGIDVRRDPVAARVRLGVVPQHGNLDRALTPRQNLQFHAAYHGVPRSTRIARSASLLDEFGLAEQADVSVDWYSGGMARRLMIARALMHEPEVLFLDEPTTGLDPQARLFVWDRIRDLSRRGVTLLLCSHDMDEAAALADRVGIMDHGRLLAVDTPEELTRGLAGQTVLEVAFVPAAGDTAEEVVAALLPLDGVKHGEVTGDEPEAKIRVYVTDTAARVLGPMAAMLTARSATLTDVHIGQPTLEDVFVHHTGRALR